MPVLTPLQARELSDALIAAFDPATLPWVVRSSIGEELYVKIHTGQAFEFVVRDLIGWIDRRGSGALEAFLNRAVAARPDVALLRAFCQTHFPDTLSEIRPSDLVRSFTSGLQVLINISSDPDVRQTVGAFYADLTATKDQIDLMAKYKGLHDTLHELQLQFDGVVDALQHRGTGLNRKVVDLAHLVRKAKPLTTGLPTKSEEDDWIDVFDSCVRDIRIVANPPPSPAAPPRVADIVNQLRQLQAEAKRINSLLALAANGMRLGSFTVMLETIGGKLRAQPAAQANVIQLIESAKSVGLLRAQLDGLVAEHNVWNKFQIDLDLAESSPMHLPQGRTPKWEKFHGRLNDLFRTYPTADWSIEFSSKLEAWKQAATSAVPEEEEKRRGDNALAELQRVCLYRFYDIDKELDAACQQVIHVAGNINTLLRLF